MGAESSSLAGGNAPKKPPLPSNFKPVAVPERNPGEAESMNLPGHPTEASHFIPYNRHDVAFTSLRLMVYHIDSRSATPIAHLLQQELGEVKAQELLTLFCSSVRAKPREFNGKREIINLAAFKQVCAKIEEARKQHAVRLRRADMQDVDVRYFGSQATIEKFKADKLAVESSNGKPYHLWPFDSRARRIGMSIIVKTDILKKLYPASRLATGEIRITTNTMQAASDGETQLTRRDSIFPFLDPITNSPTSVARLKGEAAGSNEALDRTTGGSFEDRDGLGEAQTQDQSQSLPTALSSLTIPGSRLSPDREERGVPGLDEWWNDDFERRRKQLAEWKASACKSVKGKDTSVVETRLSDLPPESTVPGIDFPVLPGLSDTYIATPDWKWYEEEIAPNEYKWQRAELEGIEAEYGRVHKKVEALTAQADELRAKRDRQPRVWKWQRDLNSAEMSLGRAIRELEMMGQAVIRGRRACAELAPLEHASADGTRPMRMARR